MVRVKEIFSSIQGEGPFVGYKQLFIRFCGCNLNCEYCDTEFDANGAVEYSVSDLLSIVNSFKVYHSVALTGGEPLWNKDFLKEFLPKCQLPVYLETNGTLHNSLEELIPYITYVSADIKLPSCSGLKSLWEVHEKFFEIASQKILFAKAVFNNNITEDEILRMTTLCKKFNIELILQPVMVGKQTPVSSYFMQEILDRCLKHYSKVRLIPQVHKFIDVN